MIGKPAAIRWRHRLLDGALKQIRLREAYELRIRGYLHERGWFESFSSEPPRDASGNPIPWINYSAIDFLSGRLTPNLRAFDRLSSIGVVLRDDAEQERYRPAFDEAVSRGFKHLVISGMKPKSCAASSIAIFYRSGSNALDL